eukprot:768084-Hanusia_phi.AAC.3
MTNKRSVSDTWHGLVQGYPPFLPPHERARCHSCMQHSRDQDPPDHHDQGERKSVKGKQKKQQSVFFWFKKKVRMAGSGDSLRQQVVELQVRRLRALVMLPWLTCKRAG